MKLLRATQSASVLLSCLINLSGHLLAQSVPGKPLAATSAATLPQPSPSAQPVRAFPSVRLWGDLRLAYVGMFSPDAEFRTPSKMAATTGHFAEEGILPASKGAQSAHLRDVPESMLVSNERLVEDFEPPAHAQSVAQAHSPMGKARNRFLTYAYGHPSVLHAPRHIASDSQQRLVISDPAGDAVHVLDPRGKTSFRIVSGVTRRLHQPAGVALDDKDNIYVADAERGMVLVFDRNGNFVRYIGSYEGEPQYASPTGIAIDRQAKRIYLADTPRNLVFVLDLGGKVLKRLGRARDGSGGGEFDEPTDIAVSHEHVFVLDRRGTRVQVMDLECNPAGSFALPHGPDPTANRDSGLSTDREGNVYVSSFHSSLIRVYSYDGRLLSAFGQPGHAVGEFVGPGGLWIDPANRLYVADSGNGRVQVFQLQPAE